MRGLYSSVLEENKKLTEKIAGLADQLNSKQQKVSNLVETLKIIAKRGVKGERVSN